MIANGENVAGGLGITPKLADELIAAGIDAITLGNHTYHRREVYAYLDAQPRILRPVNFLRSQPGHGVCTVERDGVRLGVISLSGNLYLRAGRSAFTEIEPALGEVGGAEHIIVVGSGADRIAGRELTLKIEEAAWIPTAYRDLETFLHGHLPATGESTGLVLLLTDRSGAAQRGDRARQLLAAARAVGVRSAAIVSAPVAGRIAAELTPAGRIVVAADAGLPGPVEGLFATATPLQILTERIARARGTNPDPIRRDDPRYAAASAAAES